MQLGQVAPDSERVVFNTICFIFEKQELKEDIQKLAAKQDEDMKELRELLKEQKRVGGGRGGDA